MPSALFGKWGAAQVLNCMLESCGCNADGNDQVTLPDSKDILSLLKGKMRFFDEFASKTFLELSWKGTWILNGVDFLLNKLLPNAHF